MNTTASDNFFSSARGTTSSGSAFKIVIEQFDSWTNSMANGGTQRICTLTATSVIAAED
jgi:hypothetical protein